MQLYIRMCRNERQPSLQLVEKLTATPVRRWNLKLHLVVITVWKKTSHFDYTLFFHIKMLFFSGQAEYSYFSADFNLKIFLDYSWIVIEKERMSHILFCSLFIFFIIITIIFFAVYYRYVFHVPFIELSLTLNIWLYNQWRFLRFVG